MRSTMYIWLATAMLGLSGCAALNRGSVSPSSRPITQSSLDVDKFISEHNQNADLVQSITAKPTITVAGKVMKAHPDGWLAVVRPRNFKLMLKSVGQPQADIGSNNEEFWFWVRSDDKSIYWCDYADLESSSLAITYQPDWIVAALGLTPISREEAAHIKIRSTDNRDNTALLFPPTKSGNETYMRMLIVSNHTRRIKEHRIYAGNTPDQKNLLAQADVKSYKDFDVDSSDKGVSETCYLPENVRLDWKREQLVLDVALQDVKVNQFDASRTEGLFVEPTVPGYDRVNLAKLSHEQPKDNRSTARRTLPRPEPRNGVKLGKPADVSADDASVVPRLGAVAPPPQRPVNRRIISGELEDLVRAPIPVVPETQAMQAARAMDSGTEWSPIGR
jgi:hypothetical protein